MLACSAAVLGCESQRAPVGAARLHVLAAASLADVFREIGTAFEASHPGTTVDFSFGGSNQLRMQLEQGSPGDVYAAADALQMDTAVASGVVDASSVRVFAHNGLALIVPKENRAGITSLSDLARPGLKIVVAEQSVPVGNYTLKLLEHARTDPAFGADYANGVKANIVSYEQNVAAVVAKIALNEADAGFAYLSDAAGSNGSQLVVISVPAGLQQHTDYLAAVTTGTPREALAAQFVEYLAAHEAVSRLALRGFIVPKAPAGQQRRGGGAP